MAIYKDLDFSLTESTNNDFSIIEDNQCIKTALYNNLFVSSSERGFDNTPRLNIRNALHGMFDYFMAKQIEDTIQSALILDKRIKSLRGVEFSEDAGKLVINITANPTRITQEGDTTISFTLYITV